MSVIPHPAGGVNEDLVDATTSAPDKYIILKMYELFATPFLKAVEMIFGAKGALRKLRREDRENAVKYIRGVSECLTRMAQKFTQRVSPSAECIELNVYAESMPEPVARVLGTKATEVSDLIRGSTSRRWTLHLARLAPFTHPDAQISLLEEAAGKLRALANTLEAS